MGSDEPSVYLANAWVAAAAAVAGEIVDPADWASTSRRASHEPARAVVIPGDNIDTDVLYPGTYLNVTEVEQMTHHLFEGLDRAPEPAGGRHALVVGSNFGCGSSREHTAAMRASGISFLVGAGFARIFYRNCINLGLPAVVSEAAVAAERQLHDRARPRKRRRLVDGNALPLTPVPPFMREIFAAGGLIPGSAPAQTQKPRGLEPARGCGMPTPAVRTKCPYSETTHGRVHPSPHRPGDGIRDRHAWLKREGDRVAAGEPIVEVEAEKVNYELRHR